MEFLKAAKNYSTGPTYDDEGNIVKGADPDPSSISTVEKATGEKGAYYDLNGVRMKEPSNGIFIRDGHKVVIK